MQPPFTSHVAAIAYAIGAQAMRDHGATLGIPSPMGGGMPDDSDPQDHRTHSLAARDAHSRANDDLPPMDTAEDY